MLTITPLVSADHPAHASAAVTFHICEDCNAALHPDDYSGRIGNLQEVSDNRAVKP